METPWPSSSRSLGKPSMSERAPLATMTALAPTSSSSPLEGSRYQMVWGPPLCSFTLVALAATSWAPKRSACALISAISTGPEHALGKAGVVLHFCGEHQLAAGLVTRR